jgi:hypothetical protein
MRMKRRGLAIIAAMKVLRGERVNVVIKVNTAVMARSSYTYINQGHDLQQGDLENI